MSCSSQKNPFNFWQPWQIASFKIILSYKLENVPVSYFLRALSNPADTFSLNALFLCLEKLDHLINNIVGHVMVHHSLSVPDQVDIA